MRANRRDVNEFGGVTDPVEALKIIHRKRPHDPLVNWIPHPTPTDQLYAELGVEGATRLAGYVEALIGTDRSDEAESALLCLAAFTDTPLDGCLRKLLGFGSTWPSLPFSRASSAVRDQLIGRVEQEGGNRNQILLALAWIGDEKVVEVFSQWRECPPSWRASLYIPPEDYSREAGWELAEDGSKRKLYFDRCTKLTRKGPTSPGCFLTVADSRDSCPWCRQQLTDLVTLSPSTLGIPGRGVPPLLQVTTCEICTVFGSVFGEFNEEGHGRWGAANTRPEYLPNDADGWSRLPRDPLRAAGLRPALSAADQFLPTTFSQVGGHPTWIQDASYPSCPRCGRTMMFVAQIDTADVDDHRDGMYYAFSCLDCRATATAYQQT